MKKSTFKDRARSAFKSVAVAGTALASTASFAVDDAAVTAAQSAGSASVLNASNGLLAIIAVIVGLQLVLGMMRKA